MTPTNQRAVDVHSCSLYCDRPECIKAQRDWLRDGIPPESNGWRPISEAPRDGTAEFSTPAVKCDGSPLSVMYDDSYHVEQMRARAAAWHSGYAAGVAAQLSVNPLDEPELSTVRWEDARKAVEDAYRAGRDEEGYSLELEWLWGRRNGRATLPPDSSVDEALYRVQAWMLAEYDVCPSIQDLQAAAGDPSWDDDLSPEPVDVTVIEDAPSLPLPPPPGEG